MLPPCSALPLSATEAVLLQLDEAAVADLLVQAKAGDAEAQETLQHWAYMTARTYYCLKAATHPLTPAETEDLASDFLQLFLRKWPTLDSAYRFTFAVLKRSLGYYLHHRRRRTHRETPTPPDTLEALSLPHAEHPQAFQRSDTDWYQYQVTYQVLHEADPTTYAILQYRLGDPPRPYREIATQLSLSEAAVKMRIQRFYQRVRRRYQEIGNK